MAGGKREVVNDLRGSLRIKEQLPVRWRIKDTNFSGEGRVLNISTSGLLLETPNVSAADQSVFNLESLKGNGFVLPKEGRLVWSRVKGLGSRKFCGLEFIEPSEESVAQLREKIQNGIIKGTMARRWRSIIGTILVVVMMILTAIAVRQYVENYENTLLAQQIMVGVYEKQVSLTKTYAQELASTKNLLVEAQANLEQSKIEISQLNDKNSEFQKIIAQLEEKNTQLSNELAVVQERLRLLEGDVKSLDEARALIAEYKGKFRLVKTKIKAFNREAFEAKVAAQKERDRIAMLMGNNGYLVRDGKPYKGDASAAEKRIQVDVQIVK